MTASRVTQGFHRAGIVLAVPVLLVSVALAGHEAWLQVDVPAQWWAAAPIVAPSPATRPVKLVPVEGDPFADLTSSHHAIDYAIPLAFLAASIALYVAARAIGWVIDGFISPSRS